MTFLDTSYLAAMFLVDSRGMTVPGMPADGDQVLVSDLARVEFRSAVARRRRAGTLDERACRQVLELFAREWGDYQVLAVSPSVLGTAADVVDRTSLRTLDAIQLATALLAAEGNPSPLRFGSLDARLNAAAKAEGLALLI